MPYLNLVYNIGTTNASTIPDWIMCQRPNSYKMNYLWTMKNYDWMCSNFFRTIIDHKLYENFILI